MRVPCRSARHEARNSWKRLRFTTLAGACVHARLCDYARAQFTRAREISARLLVNSFRCGLESESRARSNRFVWLLREPRERLLRSFDKRESLDQELVAKSNEVRVVLPKRDFT